MTDSIKLQQIAELTGGFASKGQSSVSRGDSGEFKKVFEDSKNPSTKPMGGSGQLGELNHVEGTKGFTKPQLEFSQHALERMRTRGVSFSPEALERIQGAVDKANAKGSKEALLLTEDSALIVSVKNNKVVTVMDKQYMKEHVFTNIDSTVLI